MSDGLEAAIAALAPHLSREERARAALGAGEDRAAARRLRAWLALQKRPDAG